MVSKEWLDVNRRLLRCRTNNRLPGVIKLRWNVWIRPYPLYP